MPSNTIYVGRPAFFGNEFVQEDKWKEGLVAVPTAEDAVNYYKMMCDEGGEDCLFVATIKMKLKGKNLACWCALDQPCHADVLLEIANPKPIEAVNE